MIKIISIENFDLKYNILKNKKSCILLLHGPGTNITSFNEYAKKAYYGGYSVVLPELRGHDQKECDNINMNLFVSDIRKILKKEKIPRVIIISNCASSLIATSFYKKYPNMVENLILLGFPQLKYLTLKSHIFHFIGHILLLARSLFNKTNKESVNWDKINNVSLIRFLMLVRKNMSFPNYLLSLDSMIHAKISLKDINVPSLLILIRSDDIINHKKLVFDTKGLSNISVEYVKKNHINDPEYDSITFKLIKTYLKKASKYP